jgi:hypothetical protein
MRIHHIAAALLALGLVGASAGAAEARDGCGPGFHRGVYGHCRPNFGPRVYRPFAYRHYGWRRHYGWHRHVGFRHRW